MHIGQTVYECATGDAWTVAVIHERGKNAGRVQLRRGKQRKYYNPHSFRQGRRGNAVSPEGRDKMRAAARRRQLRHYASKYGRHGEKIVALAEQYDLTPEQVWDSVHDLPEYQT